MPLDMPTPTTHAAAELASRGFRVFALAPGAKYPAASGWQAAATDDPLTALETIPDDGNVGICTDGLFVIDVDAGKGGLEALARLREMGTLPETFTVRSARGGLHLYYRPANGERFRCRAHGRYPDGRERFALEGLEGIDVRADGGLVVGPGSTFGGKPYKIETDAPIAELPEFVAELARRAAPRSAPVAGATIGETDQPDAIRRAAGYLVSAEAAMEGQSGDPHTIIVANRVMDFGVTPETCAELMLEYWNDRCSPPWDAGDLLYKCQSAARSRQKPIGSDNAADDYFTAMEPMPYTPQAVAKAAADPSDLLEYASDCSVAEIAARQSKDLVRQIIPLGSFGVLYGDSGAGKSFLALELGWRVAQGAVWHGRRTNRSAVLYVCLEGVDGFRKRMVAAREAYGAVGNWFARCKVHASMVRDEAGNAGVATIIKAVAALKAGCGAENVLVVIDTLARAMAGGDENSAEEMAHFAEHRAGRITRDTGAAVVVVHHTNRNGEIRGSGALFAAADFVLKATRDGQKRELRAEKVKDDDDGSALVSYVLRPIVIGADDEGEPVTSCVVHVPEHERNAALANLVRELMTKALLAGETLAPSKQAKNYAGKWLLANGAAGHAETDIHNALADLVGFHHFAIEDYKNRGDPCKRYVLGTAFQFSGGSAAVPLSGGSGGSPVVAAITAGTPKTRGPQRGAAVPKRGSSASNRRSQQRRASGGPGGSSLPTGEVVAPPA